MKLRSHMNNNYTKAILCVKHCVTYKAREELKGNNEIKLLLYLGEKPKQDRTT